MAKGLVAELKGEEAFANVLLSMSESVQKNVVDNINNGALLVHSAAVKSVQQNSGSYKESGKKGHSSSPPGQPPNTDTGNLASRIAVTTRANSASPIAHVVSAASYSNALEFGTRDMEPRPFMAPALQKHVKKILDSIARSIRNGLQEGNS